MSTPSLNEQIASCTYLVCKGCKEEKQRIPMGIYPSGRDTRYLDEDGKAWNGHTCNQCDNKIKALAQKQRRAERRTVNAKRRERYAKAKLNGRTDDTSSS